MKSFLIIAGAAGVLLLGAAWLLLRSHSFSLTVIEPSVNPMPQHPPARSDHALQLYFVPDDIGNNCAELKSVTRPWPEAGDPIRVALETQLSGPNADEAKQGLTSAIPAGVIINKLELKGRTLYADFSDALDKGVAGACRVTAIRAQITAAALQFSNVTSVEISVNGKTEGILQP